MVILWNPGYFNAYIPSLKSLLVTCLTLVLVYILVKAIVMNRFTTWYGSRGLKNTKQTNKQKQLRMWCTLEKRKRKEGTERVQTSTMSYITQLKSLILLGKAYSVDDKRCRDYGYDRKKYFPIFYVRIHVHLAVAQRNNTKTTQA